MDILNAYVEAVNKEPEEIGTSATVILTDTYLNEIYLCFQICFSFTLLGQEFRYERSFKQSSGS